MATGRVVGSSGDSMVEIGRDDVDWRRRRRRCLLASSENEVDEARGREEGRRRDLMKAMKICTVSYTHLTLPTKRIV